MQHLAIHRNGHRPRRLDNPFYIMSVDLTPLAGNCDDTARIEAFYMVAGYADIEFMYLASSHLLGALDRFGNRAQGGFYIHHYPALQAARYAIANADNLQIAIGVEFANGNSGPGSADIQSD